MSIMHLIWYSWKDYNVRPKKVDEWRKMNEENEGDSLAVCIKWINGELERWLDDEKGMWKRVEAQSRWIIIISCILW